MTEALPAAPSPHETLARIAKGLRLVTVPLPHLSGLAAAVRVELDQRVPTMGIFASGRLLANPSFVATLKENELVFVLAHELLHLALRTHDRAKGSGRIEFNYAHDYIINDILRAELGFTTIPAGGLDMPGARTKSAEQIVLEMRKNGESMPSRTRVWDGQAVSARGAFGPGSPKDAKAGRKEDGDAEVGDVLDEQRERDWFPQDSDAQAEQARKIEEMAARSLALAQAMAAMRGRGTDPGASQQAVIALRGLYRTPWEMALQKWLESAAPGERTFMRPSRRGADRHDVVLPGRKRESWMLNVVLDTSGSMTDEVPRALGAIADFCDAIAVDQIRLMQCDTAVTADDVLSPEQLAAYQVSGYGGSDLTPALLALADDPRVTAAVVVTDGDVALPADEMPYDVLWVLPANGNPGFRPPYGHVITMQAGGGP
jgi:predicted metal-dependent peptidase